MSAPHEIGPTISAILEDVRCKAAAKDVEVLEDRQPKTLDPTAGDGSTCRDVLVTWMQAGLEPAARKVIARARKLARRRP